jgi:hypothetical protein
VPPATQVGDLNLGQPVFHSALGYGTVTAIEGDDIIFSWQKDKAVTHTVKALDLLTRSQADLGFQTCYFSGGAKAWRNAAGRWASLYKNLCLMEGRGVYGEWLKQHDLNRSSIDDLVRRFENEATWAAQETVLPESGKTDQTNPAPETTTSVYAVTGSPKVNERTLDAENDERQKNIQAETSKREGIKATYHKTILFLQRRHLDPDKLGLYHAIRDAAKQNVDAIMQRKIDEGFEAVLALATATITVEPDITPSPTAERSESATSAMTEEVPDVAAPQIIDHSTDVRSALANMGFRSAKIKEVQFSPGLDFNESLRQALKQLKPELAEKEVETCTF